jgi:hypothetical protein
MEDVHIGSIVGRQVVIYVGTSRGRVGGVQIGYIKGREVDCLTKIITENMGDVHRRNF